MKQRVITGAVYVLVLVALLVLKWLVPFWGAIGYDAFFCAVAVIGCIEFTTNFKEISFPQKTVSIAFCSVIVPLYAAVEMSMGGGYIAGLICLAVYVIAALVLWAFRAGGSDKFSTLYSILAMLYCGVLSCLLSAVNHLPHNSVAAIMLMFFSVLLTDTAAYLSGSLLKKYIPYKLAPAISPNKTVIGFVGGIIGGTVGAVAAYYVFYGLGIAFGTPLVYTGSLPAAVAFLLIGLAASVFGQAGDLLESALKRKCGVKDMGKVLPGHGGVLDRLDSVLVSGIVILISFSVLFI